MPTYEYACESCGNRYEKRESFSASPRQKCPKCGRQAQRVIFAPPIVFKGSGFYSTDNRSSNGSGDGSASSAGESSNGHGHSHGPDGGHTHDSATEASAAS